MLRNRQISDGISKCWGQTKTWADCNLRLISLIPDFATYFTFRNYIAGQSFASNFRRVNRYYF